MLASIKRQRASAEAVKRMKHQSTFTEPIHVTPNEKPAMKAFLADFYHTIYTKRNEIKLILQCNQVLQDHYEQLVSTKVVSYEDFWQRYYWRCDPVRILDEWERKDHERAEARAKTLQERMASVQKLLDEALHREARGQPSVDGIQKAKSVSVEASKCPEEDEVEAATVETNPDDTKQSNRTASEDAGSAQEPILASPVLQNEEVQAFRLWDQGNKTPGREPAPADSIGIIHLKDSVDSADSSSEAHHGTSFTTEDGGSTAEKTTSSETERDRVLPLRLWDESRESQPGIGFDNAENPDAFAVESSAILVSPSDSYANPLPTSSKVDDCCKLFGSQPTAEKNRQRSSTTAASGPAVILVLFFSVALPVWMLSSSSIPLMDGLCSPAPYSHILKEGRVRLEAPWWAPDTYKAAAFSCVCGSSRMRTAIEWESRKQPNNRLRVLAMDDHDRVIFKRRRLSSARVYAQQIELLTVQGSVEQLLAPWTKD